MRLNAKQIAACTGGAFVVEALDPRALITGLTWDSRDVKAGDVLELRFGERTVKVEVLSVAEHVGKADAPALYKELL